MRAVLVLVAAATLVAACTPAASAPALDATPSVAGPTPAGQLASGAAGVTASETPEAAAPAPTGSAARSAAAAPGPPLAPNPYDLGGPAPVGSFVLGDSIALGVAPQLTRLGYPVVGIVGRAASETYLREHLATPLAQQAPAWVIVLGTNNRGDDADVAGLEGLIGVIDSLRTPGARQRVFWVTPHRDPRYAGGLAGWNLAAFGAELDRLAGERPWLEVIDFAATAQLHPEWYDADAGRLHPDGRGQGVLAALIAGPDAVPVEIPAPVFSGAPSPPPGPEPETFVNAPQQPATRKAPPTPTSTTTPPPNVAPTPASTPLPLDPPAPPSPAASMPAESPAEPATPS